jgi:hypothetical protein
MNSALRNPELILQGTLKRMEMMTSRNRPTGLALMVAGSRALSVSHGETAEPWQSVIDDASVSCDIRLSQEEVPQPGCVQSIECGLAEGLK